MNLRLSSARLESAAPSNKAVVPPSGTDEKLPSILVELVPVEVISINTPKVEGAPANKASVTELRIGVESGPKVAMVEPVGIVVVGWVFEVSSKTEKVTVSELPLTTWPLRMA